MGCATMQRFWVAPFHSPATTTKRPRKTTAAADFTSCLPFGCTDENACNYDPDALYEDGTCGMPTSPTTAMATVSTTPMPMAFVMSWKSPAA